MDILHLRLHHHSLTLLLYPNITVSFFKIICKAAAIQEMQLLPST